MKDNLKNMAQLTYMHKMSLTNYLLYSSITVDSDVSDCILSLQIKFMETVMNISVGL